MIFFCVPSYYASSKKLSKDVRRRIQRNVRENRRCIQECKIKKQWQHWVHKTQNEDKQNKKLKTVSSAYPIKNGNESR